jgi:hypothetical protein
VNISNKWDVDTTLDFSKNRRIFHLWNGYADDLASNFFQAQDLGNR